MATPASKFTPWEPIDRAALTPGELAMVRAACLAGGAASGHGPITEIRWGYFLESVVFGGGTFEEIAAFVNGGFSADASPQSAPPSPSPADAAQPVHQGEPPTSAQSPGAAP